MTTRLFASTLASSSSLSRHRRSSQLLYNNRYRLDIIVGSNDDGTQRRNRWITTTSTFVGGNTGSRIGSSTPSFFTIPHHFCSARQQQQQQQRSLSSSTSSDSGGGVGFFDRMKNQFTDRMERKKAEKQAESFEKMAAMEAWTIDEFAKDTKKVLSSWRSKIPGLSDQKQMAMMKESQKIIDAIMDVAGPKSTSDDLGHLGRKEKLKICIKAEVPVEDVNALIKQFQGMQLIHQVLRYRKEKGKPLPKDENEMKAAIQEDGRFAMTKRQLMEMKEQYRKSQGGRR